MSPEGEGVLLFQLVLNWTTRIQNEPSTFCKYANCSFKKMFFLKYCFLDFNIHWLPLPSTTLSFVPCCVLDVLFASVLLLFWGRSLTKETSTISNFLQEELRFVFCPNPLREKNPSLQSNRMVYVLNDLALISAVCLEVSNVKRHLDRRFQSWLTWVPPAVMGTYFLEL